MHIPSPFKEKVADGGLPPDDGRGCIKYFSKKHRRAEI